jgi:hypothetical protein
MSEPLPFRRLLKNVTNGRYLAKGGRWTASLEEARDFSSMTEAVQAGLKLGTNGLALVLKFPDSRFDIVHTLDKPSDTQSSPLSPENRLPT